MILYYIYIALLLSCILTLVWRRKDNKPYYKYLLLLLIITIIVELAKVITTSSVNPVFSYLNNFYLLSEAVLMALVYKSVISSKLIKKALNWSIVTSIVFFNFAATARGLDSYNVLFMAYCHVSVIIFGIIYLFEIYSPPFTENKLIRNPFFWINTANLFFYAGIFLQLGLDTYIEDISEKQADQLLVINKTFNYLIYFLYTIGFLSKKIFK